MKNLALRCVVVLLAVFASGFGGQEQESQPGQERPEQRRDSQPEIKPYEKVITKDAKSDQSVFTLHRIKEKVWYEIPKSELGKDFLWVSQIARTTLGAGYGGQGVGNGVVRWERHGDRVLLRSVSCEVVADGSLPISRAVRAANNEAILTAFNIEALGKEEAPVIEVTRLFTTEVPEFSGKARLRARAFDANRSFLERVVSFPQNIEVEATYTFTSPIEPTAGTGRPTPTPAPAPRPSVRDQTGMRPGSATVLMHYSMVKVPEKPMMPRLYDERVGYFSVRRWITARTSNAPRAAPTRPTRPASCATASG